MKGTRKQNILVSGTTARVQPFPGHRFGGGRILLVQLQLPVRIRRQDGTREAQCRSNASTSTFFLHNFFNHFVIPGEILRQRGNLFARVDTIPQGHAWGESWNHCL